jgi:hypothetical protein
VAGVVSLDDVAAMAMGLPEVEEGEFHGRRTWTVRGGKKPKAFVWERHFSKADVRRYGDARVPGEPIVAITVEDLSEKEAVLQAGHPGFFTIPHFDGYSAVLVELGEADDESLHAAIVDGWLACAPAELAKEYLTREEGRGSGA